jgi:telomerase reverse transcriptase
LAYSLYPDVRKFIEARRFETFSLHFLLQGFSTADCEWLMPPGEKAREQGRVCVSDSLKRRELLEEFMFWYFDGFLMPLLKVGSTLPPKDEH